MIGSDIKTKYFCYINLMEANKTCRDMSTFGQRDFIEITAALRSSRIENPASLFLLSLSPIFDLVSYRRSSSIPFPQAPIILGTGCKNQRQTFRSIFPR